MDYRTERPALVVAGTNGGSYSLPISAPPKYGHLQGSEPYRRLLDTIGSLLELPNIFYMGRGRQGRPTKANIKKGWVERNPKHLKEKTNNNKGKK